MSKTSLDYIKYHKDNDSTLQYESKKHLKEALDKGILSPKGINFTSPYGGWVFVVVGDEYCFIYHEYKGYNGIIKDDYSRLKVYHTENESYVVKNGIRIKLELFKY